MAGTLGCVPCKADLLARMNRFLEPMRKKREMYMKEKGLVRKILAEGSAQASAHARKTLDSALQVIGIPAYQGVS